MSNLEHLIENGLCHLSEGKSYRKWCELMQQDCNWAGNENITLQNLWEICQYVIFAWDSNKEEIVRCEDCINCVKNSNGELYCDILAVGYEPLGSKKVNRYWYCADGERKESR